MNALSALRCMIRAKSLVRSTTPLSGALSSKSLIARSFGALFLPSNSTINSVWQSALSTTTHPTTTTHSRSFTAAAAEAKQEEQEQEQEPEEEEWVSLATRDYATAQHRSIQISPRKLQFIIRPLRGLSASEAMIQCQLSSKKKAVFVENCISNACVHAVNNYNMDRSRLVIDEIYCTKGRYLKRINFQGRGKTGIRFRYYSHLKVRVREQPPEPGEVRLGKWGQKHTTIKRTLERMEEYKKWKEQEKERTKDQYM